MKQLLLCATLVVTSTATAKAADGQLAKLFEELVSTVVVVHVMERAATPDRPGLTSVSGIGSGVVISDDGLIMTAAHVVQTADEVQVEFSDGKRFWARIISSEPQADVALVKLEEPPKNMRVAKLGDSDKVRVGDQIFVVGAPYGLSHTLTVGHVSARHRSGRGPLGLALGDFFQTDAAINQGNSGGPMFNMRGEVIGIVSHILSKSGGFEGLGFVATSNLAKNLLLDRPPMWSGMEGFTLSGDLAR
ncbi:MAG: trypsin-like peptidase domain-containing protein, partial [Gammaproteobacteria bacterium]|nr:trypsin-like peptidase domain-containing protein [Gammaproteobacteria bacterium]